MKRIVRVVVLSGAWGCALVACGDVEGNVIVRVASSEDAGGCGSSGTCVDEGGSRRECATNAECSAATPLCDPAGACVECLGASDCNKPGKPFCNPATRACSECVVNSDCIDPREQCSVDLKRCAAPCKSDGDCRSDDPLCDLAIGFCVGCRSVDDCKGLPDRPFCVEGDCVACANGQC